MLLHEVPPAIMPLGMSSYDFSAQRLYVDAPLSDAERITCSRDQANYLLNVLRLREGDNILLFNGKDGEWRAHIAEVSKRDCVLVAEAQMRPQTQGPDIHYLFAPLKRARIDYMVQKATELGVCRLQPVFTQRTQNARVKLDRLRANAIEAAEQCGILSIPEVAEPEKLEAVLHKWPAERRLIYCDEGAELASPIDTLNQVSAGPLAVLIGPEGGFDQKERDILRAQPFVTTLSLGPRIMRADTAAVAALALVNAVLGDW